MIEGYTLKINEYGNSRKSFRLSIDLMSDGKYSNQVAFWYKTYEETVDDLVRISKEDNVPIDRKTLKKFKKYGISIPII